MEEVNVDRKKKVQKEVIKRNDDTLMPPSESVSSSSLENKGQNGEIKNRSLKDQIMESSNLEVNKSFKEIPRTISPDINGKTKSESKEVVKMKDEVVSWEIKTDEKFGNTIELDLLGERPNFDAFYCMLESEREWKSSWDVGVDRYIC